MQPCTEKCFVWGRYGLLIKTVDTQGPQVPTSKLLSGSSFFFYLGFPSRTFTIHIAAGEWGGYLFNSSLTLPPASQTLRN